MRRKTYTININVLKQKKTSMNAVKYKEIKIKLINKEHGKNMHKYTLAPGKNKKHGNH